MNKKSIFFPHFMPADVLRFGAFGYLSFGEKRKVLRACVCHSGVADTADSSHIGRYICRDFVTGRKGMEEGDKVGNGGRKSTST